MGDEHQPATYGDYADFLAADPRRAGDALELGADWRDGDDRYRVCWYEETSELTIERLAADEPLDLENFHRGIAGPVEVLGRVPNRDRLTALLGEWPNIAVGHPRSIAHLKQLLRQALTA